MIEIKKGNHVLSVSKNTYETMFKRMGYHIVGEEAKKTASSATVKNAPKKHQEAEKEVLSIETDNLSFKEEKTAKIEPDAKENNPDESNNKLEDILGIISNNKKTSENSKSKKEE